MRLTRKQFFKFLETLKPTEYEAMSDDSTRTLKQEFITYPVYHRERFYLAVRALLNHLSTDKPVICDLGTYPGALMHILHSFLPGQGISPVLYGAGLHIQQDFRETMEREFSAKTFVTNLDPANPDLRDRTCAGGLPLADNSADAVIATEVIEHLTNPLPMIQEAFRLLKPGGVIVITTPNATRIGSVFKLLAGISNFDRLIPIGYSDPDDEWRPHFREYSMRELSSLLQSCGFEPSERTFFHRECTRFNVKSVKQKLIDTAKFPFYVIPHLRGSILIAGIRKRHA